MARARGYSLPRCLHGREASRAASGRVGKLVAEICSFSARRDFCTRSDSSIIFVIVLVPEIMSSIVGVTADALVSLGIETLRCDSGDRGKLEVVGPRGSLNEAIAAIPHSTFVMKQLPILTIPIHSPFYFGSATSRRTGLLGLY